MVLFGKKQDLIYYALRRIINRPIEKVVIKTSAEYLLDGDINEVIRIISLSRGKSEDKKSLSTLSFMKTIEMIVGENMFKKIFSY